MDIARRLLHQISPYVSEAPTQALTPSPFLRSIGPSPWEALSFNLANAILAIGLRHPSLHQIALELTIRYLHSCLKAIDATPSPKRRNGAESTIAVVGLEAILCVATIATSLIGFLEAASRYFHFYTTPEKLQVIRLLRQTLNEDFLISVEGSFSSLRASEIDDNNVQNWKLYTKRYATSGRPLGAMLLQCGFMTLVFSCSSLLILDEKQLQRADVFENLISRQAFPDHGLCLDSPELIEMLTEIAIEEIQLLQDGADYLQLGSAWQQKLAFAVKAYTLSTYMNCIVADEEIAEADIFASWLEDVLADPVQMADQALSTAILKSIPLVSKLSPAFATTFSRLLPRFIVQGSVRGEIIDSAAHSLAYVLLQLSQDAVITGLYSLGNVLSASNSERAVGTVGLPESTLGTSRMARRYNQHASGSAISLDVSGDEETAAVYGNVVRGIVGVANHCHDEKITALALSMLLQKLGRITLSVDIHIIKEAARLVTSGGSVELKSILKLYSRIGHDGAIQRNEALLAAVRFTQLFFKKLSLTVP